MDNVAANYRHSLITLSAVICPDVGTQMTEGAGLCVAFLRQMALMPRRPHLLMASHYQRHLYAFLANNSAINFLTFSRHLAGNRLVQLYSVVPGITTSSFASFVSRDAGLVEEVSLSEA